MTRSLMRGIDIRLLANTISWQGTMKTRYASNPHHARKIAPISTSATAGEAGLFFSQDDMRRVSVRVTKTERKETGIFSRDDSSERTLVVAACLYSRNQSKNSPHKPGCETTLKHQ